VLVWGRQVIGFVVDNRVKVIAQEDKAMAGSIAALGYLAQMALLIIVLLLILANLGVEVTALVASIGIGGIALAMAAQNVLSDFIAFISIALDKPFVPGEFMNVGDFSGTVEQIGLRTTRLRSLSGEQLLLSNRDLLSSRIRNYGRMLQRRVVGLLGVTYQTSYENVQAIPQIIQEIVEGIEEATFDRAHFKRYADFALEFEFVYYVTPPAYALFMDVQQKVNLEIMKRFAEAGIEFAYPTQTIFLAKTKQ
jgi:small-conductance mechanosensitive channel